MVYILVPRFCKSILLIYELMQSFRAHTLVYAKHNQILYADRIFDDATLSNLASASLPRRFV